MSTNTPNFNLVLPEGTDTFNPLTFNNNAFTRIDEIMKANQDRGLCTATHLYLDGINTITRSIGTCNLFVFIATSDYVSGSQIAVDGITVSFRYADGTAPANNAFRTNQAVICYLNGTILTMVSTGVASEINAKLGDLENLTTEDKTNIVNALNEINDDKASKSELKSFNNCLETVTNILLVNLDDTRPKGVKTSDASTLIDAPVSSGYFYAVRELFILDGTHFFVKLTEIYPTEGRVWTNIFNSTSWRGWKSTTPN